MNGHRFDMLHSRTEESFVAAHVNSFVYGLTQQCTLGANYRGYYISIHWLQLLLLHANWNVELVRIYEYVDIF